MKKFLLTVTLLCIYGLLVHSQAVYFDSNTGNDKNTGTKELPLLIIHKAAKIIKSRDNDICIIRLSPGIFVPEKPFEIFTDKDINGKRIIIESAISPDDTSWTPEQMPAIVNKSEKDAVQHDSQPN